MDYRSDLTGLRALAVVAVVFYHFGVPGFGGGFAGVDVFFVISGYLMTRIVAGGLSSGNFSFSKFYLSRAKRIVPALAVLCLVLLVLGLLYLGKRDFYALSRHAVFSVLFLSNFAYRNEASYFDADAHEKWLLHTWSLSVEWQFYLLYPLVLASIVRFWRPDTPGFRRALWLLAAASFIISVLTTRVQPTHMKSLGARNYFLPVKINNGFIRNNHEVFWFSDRDIARCSNVFLTRKMGVSASNRKFLQVCRNFQPDVYVLRSM